jgi:hypothetical protein
VKIIPKNVNIKKVIVLGSGAIKIGEAGESYRNLMTANLITLVRNVSKL